MRSRGIIYIFALLVLITACKKDEPAVILYTGLTRIEYNVINPFEKSGIVFEFENSYNLEEHTQFNIALLTTEESYLLNLTILLEDDQGNINDAAPIHILDEDLINSAKVDTYSFNINDYSGSITSTTGKIDLSKISKVHILINSGITGKVGNGKFWLKQLEFVRAD